MNYLSQKLCGTEIPTTAGALGGHKLDASSFKSMVLNTTITLTELDNSNGAKASVTTLGVISIFAGYLSMGFWLFAQLPQVIENYKNHSVDGIALGFLASWVTGDVSNLIGCLLTNALPFQVLLSSYYCSIDLILSSQYLYYTKIYPKLKHHIYFNQRLQKFTENNEDAISFPSDANEFPQEHILSSLKEPVSVIKASDPKDISTGSGTRNMNIRNDGQARSSATLSSFLPTNYSLTNMVTGSFLASFSKVKGYPIMAGVTSRMSDPTSASDPASNMDFIMTVIADNSEFIGNFFAWLCTCMYLSARIPQLIKNHKRQCTDGISILLFICALNGNIFYTISILTSDEFANAGSSLARYEFFMKELPYILGSAGTVFFDFAALYQWRKYRHNSVHHQALYRPGQDAFPNPQADNVDDFSEVSGYNYGHNPIAALTSSAENHETKLSHSSRLSTDISDNQNITSYCDNSDDTTFCKLPENSLLPPSEESGTQHLTTPSESGSSNTANPINTAYSSLRELLASVNGNPGKVLETVESNEVKRNAKLSFGSTDNNRRSYGSVFSAVNRQNSNSSYYNSATDQSLNRPIKIASNKQSSTLNTPLTPWDLLGSSVGNNYSNSLKYKRGHNVVIDDTDDDLNI